MTKVLIIEDNEIIRIQVKLFLEENDYQVYCAENQKQAWGYLRRFSIDIVILDLILPDVIELELLENMTFKYPSLPIIILSSLNDSRVGANVIKSGAKDFILKEDFERNQEILLNALQNLSDIKKYKNLNDAFIAENSNILNEIHIPDLPLYRNAFDLGIKALRGNLNILVTGPTGSGKEIFVKYLHQIVNPENPLITVNCGAICDSLAESELFGHEKYSFTGAQEFRKGKLELANNGLLFLDELGNIPMRIQEMLLRTIEDKKITRIGSNKEIEAQFSIISATNADLDKLIREKHFREDLFYRLKQIEIRLPSLSENREALLSFTKYFIDLFNRKYQTTYLFNESLIEHIFNKEWRGGVRELKNEIQMLVSMFSQGMDIPLTSNNKTNDSFNFKEKVTLLEKDEITKVLIKNNYNIKVTAEEMGIKRQTLDSKIRRYKIELKRKAKALTKD